MIAFIVLGLLLFAVYGAIFPPTPWKEVTLLDRFFGFIFFPMIGITIMTAVGLFISGIVFCIKEWMV